ncbi:hypothetical protein IEO21_04903 [Rhodonia placenta]|uniref:Uncharacterized protein n=1 Tax=Rhodonia placenta TaxID=104341 RepID=A0A8H7P380_9APHY|nr:hypothetical protein IEO21_04903 [Postia placenta]
MGLLPNLNSIDTTFWDNAVAFIGSWKRQLQSIKDTTVDLMVESVLSPLHSEGQSRRDRRRLRWHAYCFGRVVPGDSDSLVYSKSQSLFRTASPRRARYTQMVSIDQNPLWLDVEPSVSWSDEWFTDNFPEPKGEPPVVANAAGPVFRGSWAHEAHIGFGHTAGPNMHPCIGRYIQAVCIGRNENIEAFKALLLQRSHILISGTGNVGKKAIALAMLHHPEVASALPARYFVSEAIPDLEAFRPRLTDSMSVLPQMRGQQLLAVVDELADASWFESAVGDVIIVPLRFRQMDLAAVPMWRTS